VHRTLAKLNLWLVGSVLLVALPFLPLIYPVWTNKKLTLDAWTVGFLVVRMMFWSVWNASSTVLLATNRHRRVALILLGEALLTGVLAVVLVPRLGIKGAALAALISDVSISAWLIPRLALRETGDNVNGFLAAMTGAITAIVIPVSLGLVGWRFVTSAFLRYVLVAPVSALLGMAIVLWQLDASERRVLIYFYGRVAGKPNLSR
jgi:O-antigen/teichoic acid export membrane protein